MHDVVVVGKGLIGSAAFRHLAERGADTLLIGPDEPVDTATHDGVFGAHYDEARLTHLHGRSPVWAELCRRSIVRYRELEARSGIAFAEPIGELFVADAAVASPYTAPDIVRHSRETLGVDLVDLDADAVGARFPSLALPDDSTVLWERGPAGYLNPRAMLRAEVALGHAAGGRTLADIVVGTTRRGDHMVVRTRSGDEFAAGHVLVASGAFANSFDQLPRPLALRCKTEHVVFARVSAEGRRHLAGLPVMHYDLHDDVLANVYLVPPVRYPDGHHYLKLGANTSTDRFLASTEEMQAWYRNGDSDRQLPAMRALVRRLFPGLTVDGWHTGRCVITRTPHQLPMIDTIEPGLSVAVGGNGSSAACADALGELAAELVHHGGWHDELAADRFAAVSS